MNDRVRQLLAVLLVATVVVSSVGVFYGVSPVGKVVAAVVSDGEFSDDFEDGSISEYDENVEINELNGFVNTTIDDSQSASGDFSVRLDADSDEDGTVESRVRLDSPAISYDPGDSITLEWSFRESYSGTPTHDRDGFGEISIRDESCNSTVCGEIGIRNDIGDDEWRVLITDSDDPGTNLDSDTEQQRFDQVAFSGWVEMRAEIEPGGDVTIFQEGVEIGAFDATHDDANILESEITVSYTANAEGHNIPISTDIWYDDVSLLQEGVTPSGEVSGTVVNQDGDGVSNATVQVWGVDHNQLSGDNIKEQALDEIEAAVNKTPDDWTDQLESSFQLTGAGGHFDDVDAKYVAVHEASDWQPGGVFSGHVFDNPDLRDPVLSVAAPDREPVPLAFSVWDASKEEGFLGDDGVKEDLPGQPVTGRVIVESVGPSGDVYRELEAEPTELRAGGFLVGTDYSEAYQVIRLPPGFYKVYPKDREASAYVIKVGDPIEIILEDLQTSAKQDVEQAKDVAENLVSGLFEKKTTTTDANGDFSVEVSSNVETVAVQAYKAPDVSVNDSDLQVSTIVNEYEDAFEDGIEQERLGSVWLPSAVTRADPPATDVEVTLIEVTSPPYGEIDDLQDLLDERLEDLLDEALADVFGPWQEPTDEVAREELEKLAGQIDDLADANGDLRDRIDDLLEDQRDTYVEVIEDGSDEELREQVEAAYQAIQELRTELDAEVDTIVETDTISQVYSFGGDVDEETATLLLHYSNGTTQTLTTDSPYLSVNKRPGLSDQLILDDFPINDTDPATITFEVLAAEEGTGAIGRVTETVRNPHFDGDVPKLDSISVSSIEPGPDDQVDVTVHPDDPTKFGELTSVTVSGPSGSITADAISSDGRSSGFKTDGAGIYHIELAFNNSDGDPFTETIRLSADDFDDARPPSAQVRSGTTGRFLLVGDGLHGGEIQVGEDGQTVTIAARIDQSDDAPGSVHLYTQSIDTGSRTITRFKLTRGSNDESVQKQIGVVLHTDDLGETPILYRELVEPLPRDGSNQYGIVNSSGDNGTNIQTYTQGDGTVDVLTDTDAGFVDRAFYRLRIRFPGIPGPAPVITPDAVVRAFEVIA